MHYNIPMHTKYKQVCQRKLFGTTSRMRLTRSGLRVPKGSWRACTPPDSTLRVLIKDGVTLFQNFSKKESFILSQTLCFFFKLSTLLCEWCWLNTFDWLYILKHSSTLRSKFQKTNTSAWLVFVACPWTTSKVYQHFPFKWIIFHWL